MDTNNEDTISFGFNWILQSNTVDGRTIRAIRFIALLFQFIFEKLIAETSEIGMFEKLSLFGARRCRVIYFLFFICVDVWLSCCNLGYGRWQQLTADALNAHNRMPPMKIVFSCNGDNIFGIFLVSRPNRRAIWRRMDRQTRNTQLNGIESCNVYFHCVQQQHLKIVRTKTAAAMSLDFIHGNQNDNGFHCYA